MTREFKPGQRVRIQSVPTTLVRRMGPAYPGGWLVDPEVFGMRYWNEDDMVRYRPRKSDGRGATPQHRNPGNVR